MKFILKQILSLDLRACVVCEKLFIADIPLCQCCQADLFVEMELCRGPLIFKGVLVYPIVKWNQLNDFLIRPLVYSLKSGKNTLLSFWLAELWNIKYKAWRPIFKSLAPIPGKAGNEKDHAYRFGAGLAEALEMKFVCPGRRLGLKSLKSLGLAERKQSVSFDLKLSYQESVFRKLLLVDDIYCTGASTEAYWEALKIKSSKHVAVIAYREKKQLL